MMILLESWHRVLLGGVIGVVGVAAYFVARLMQETTEHETRSWWLGTFIAAATGMVLAGVADWILRPVTVPTWLRWTIIGMAGVLGITSFIGSQRARSNDKVVLMVVFYFVALFFSLLAIRLVFLEIFK